jgi:chromosome segregation ATPase
LSSVDITDDWQQRAGEAQRELVVQRRKLKKDIHRLRQQVEEYCEALRRQTQDYTQLMSQCQQLSNTNINLVRENERARSMVETLEAVIMMLYTHPTRTEATQAQ